MTTQELAKKYVQLCKDHNHDEIVNTLMSGDIVSVEAAAPPTGGERTAKGLEAVKAKGKWWVENHTIHSADVQGPFPHDDRFAVRFTYDVTNKPSGMRMKMDEVGLFTVVNGKIVREEFFYSMGG